MSRRRVFRGVTYRNIEHLWSDSSDDDDENGRMNNPVDVEMIDLTGLSESSESSANNTVTTSTQTYELLPLSAPFPSQSPSLPPPAIPQEQIRQQQQQQIIPSYVPRTLQPFGRRYMILPAFPSSFYDLQPPLLLANVPEGQLSQTQLTRRGEPMGPIGYTPNNNNFNFPCEFRNRYQAFIGSLVVQHNVDVSIIEYNLYRMDECLKIFSNELIRRHRCNPEIFTLSDEQKTYALEFYLQIDVDLFFMKTCSFRDAQPRSTDKGLFCINEPDVRYGIIACNKCSLCMPKYDVDLRGQPVIYFGPNQEFQFLNGYRTILNCNAYCRTQNIIYVMTCPCGQFEYIGETSLKLYDRLKYHREHFNRIIHEFLIGIENVKRTQSQTKDQPTLSKDGMRLYKHAARCPSVIYRFISFNPIYECFIPIFDHRAEQQNQDYSLPPSLILLDNIYPTSIASTNLKDRPKTSKTRSDEEVRLCMRKIPPVPNGYTFSTSQRVKQFQYFKEKLDENAKQHEFIDLFNATIIAVLPHDATRVVRQFVESLFITHTETKLNTSGRLVHDDDDTNDNNNINMHHIHMNKDAWIADRGEWCRDVI